MKATGIVRKVDSLNRIVIPKELCNTMSIAEGTPLEIYTDGQRIMLQKYTPGCIFCESIENLTPIKGKLVCGSCSQEVAAAG